MKKSLLFLIVASVLFVSSCKKDDGKPGAVYLQVYSSSCIYLGTASFGGLPSGASYGTSYLSSAGTYSYYYYYSDAGCGYSPGYNSGSYTLEAAPGGKGTYTSKGSDGETRYYYVSCYASGAYSTYY